MNNEQRDCCLFHLNITNTSYLIPTIDSCLNSWFSMRPPRRQSQIIISSSSSSWQQRREKTEQYRRKRIYVFIILAIFVVVGIFRPGGVDDYLYLPTSLPGSNREMLFHFVHTTKESDFSRRSLRTIETVFFHHPNAKVIVHIPRDSDKIGLQSDMTNAIFRPLINGGYDVTVEPFHQTSQFPEVIPNVHRVYRRFSMALAIAGNQRITDSSI